MKREEKQKLIKMLKAIVKEIRVYNSYDYPCHFFMCLDSDYALMIQEYLPALVEFGEEHIPKFNGHYAFLYGKGLTARQYNDHKIKHLEMYISSLQSKSN